MKIIVWTNGQMRIKWTTENEMYDFQFTDQKIKISSGNHID